MSQIQSSVGLITGIPIQETVDQLMAIAARPRNQLANRNSSLESERLAVDRLSSLVLAFQFEVNGLKQSSVFKSKEIASSNSDVLSATLAPNGNPPLGSFQFTPVQTATAQQLVSNSFEDLSEAFSSGSLSFRFGGFVNEGIKLSQLNSGDGFVRGKIRITDRTGASADVDLRYAQTVDDVLAAINNSSTINVTAVAEGDSFKLIDKTSGGGNLSVSEIGSGTTAASLGLAGIDTTNSEATGDDVFTLHAGTKLSTLNDKNGVQIRSEGTADLRITFLDESAALEIDLAGSKTLGDVIGAINAADPDRLSAQIAADGNRIELSDLTSGAGAFSVTSIDGGTAAEDLGVATSTTSDTITGGRLVAGLRDTLIASLRGGQGLGTLGQVDITNRDGVVSNVDLSAAETLGDVVDLINNQATGVTASINTARHGILLTDTTGGTASNLIVANGDANNTADALGITVDDAVAKIDSGTLNRQSISAATLLTALNNGDGIDLRDFRITDSAGVVGTIDLNTAGSEAVTVGDVINRINDSQANVLARINDTGDGIVIIDQADGEGTLQVTEVGNGTAAADLGILGKGVDVDGTQQIDGTAGFTIDLTDLTTPGGAALLSSLNGGDGIDRGDFIIESSVVGKNIAIDLDDTDSDVLTVGELIDRINEKAAASGVAVTASLNEAGTGITLVDAAGGERTLSVRDVGSDTAAADLGLTAAATTSGATQTIESAGLFSSSAGAEAGLAALATRINELDAGVAATTFNDGTGFRLSLTVGETGAGRQLLIDTAGGPLAFQEVTEARDAILEFGGSASGTGVVLTSSTNQFNNVVSGVNVTVNSASSDPVTVSVTKTDQSLVSAAEDFVAAYNSIRTNLDDFTSFNPDEQTTGILFGTNAALRVDADLSNVLTRRFFGAGRFESLEAVGIRFGQDGKLSLDTEKLKAAFASDPEGVEEFFTDKTSGVAAKITAVIDSLATNDNSLLTTRSESLADIVERNTDRLAFMDERLAAERDRMLLEFFRLEETISRLQQNLTALDSLQVVAPVTSSGRGATSLFAR